jgi:hypothetical protein
MTANAFDDACNSISAGMATTERANLQEAMKQVADSSHAVRGIPITLGEEDCNGVLRQLSMPFQPANHFLEAHDIGSTR